MPHCIYCHEIQGLVQTDIGPVCPNPECSDKLDTDLFQLEMQDLCLADQFVQSDGVYYISDLEVL